MIKLSKKAVYKVCLDFADERIRHAQSSLNAATESGNTEDKSSAGDKHETGRAMAQLEQEKAAKQLNEAQELKKNLLKINSELNSAIAQAGSIVVTDKNTFYISIAAGKMEVEGQAVFALSPVSPVGKKLLGISAGEQLEFNGQVYHVKEVY